MAIHNSVEQHVSDFIKLTTFSEIVDLYHLPTLVIAFTDYRKKVKAQNPKVDMTKITFGPQEARVEENGDNMTAKFQPAITLKWEWDEVGKNIFPSKLEYEFVIVDEEEVEAPRTTEVGDNVRNEEMDQNHQIID